MSTILPNKIYVIVCYKWKLEKVTFINQAGWMAPSAVCTDLTQMILVPFVDREGEEKIWFLTITIFVEFSFPYLWGAQLGEGGGDAQLAEGKGSALKLHPLTSVVAWAAFDFECHQMLWFQLLLHIKHLNVHQTPKDMSKAPPLIILWIISPLRSCIVYKSPKYCKSNLYFQL